MAWVLPSLWPTCQARCSYKASLASRVRDANSPEIEPVVSKFMGSGLVYRWMLYMMCKYVYTYMYVTKYIYIHIIRLQNRKFYIHLVLILHLIIFNLVKYTVHLEPTEFLLRCWVSSCGAHQRCRVRACDLSLLGTMPTRRMQPSGTWKKCLLGTAVTSI